MTRIGSRFGRFGAVVVTVACMHTPLMAEGDAYQDMSVSQLRSAVEALPTDEAAKEQREAVAHHIHRRMRAMQRAEEAIEWEQWLPIILHLEAEVSGEAKRRVARSIAQTLASDSSALATVPFDTLKKAVEAHRRLAPGNFPAELASGWVLRSEQYKQLHHEQLLWLSQQVHRAKEANKAVQRLVHAMEENTLADAERIRAAGIDYWLQAGQAMGRGMTAEQRRDWANRIHEAIVHQPQVLEALSYQQLRQLVAQFGAMGDERVTALCVQWTLAQNTLDALENEHLLGLARQLHAGADAAEPARHRLAEHLNQRVLGDRQKVSAFSPHQLRALLGTVRDEFEDDHREAWLRRSREVYVQDREVFTNLSGQAVTDLRHLLTLLGDDDALSVIPEHVKVSPRWHEVRDIGVLAVIARASRRDEQASRAVARHMFEKYLTDAQAYGSSRHRYLSSFTPAAGLLPEAERQQWITQIRLALAPTADDVRQLSAGRAHELVIAIGHLDQNLSVDLAMDWLRHADLEEASGNLPALYSVATRVMRSHRAPAELREATFEAIDQLAAAAAENKPMGFLQYVALSKFARTAGQPESELRWAERAYAVLLGDNQNLAQVQLGQLELVCDLLYNADARDPQKVYSRLIQAVQHMVQQGTFHPDHAIHVGGMLADEQSINVLQSLKVDAQGYPRMGVVKVLCWAQGEPGMAAFKQVLAQRAEHAQDGDAKALWLLGLAYAESLVHGQRSPLRGEHFMRQALTVAQNPAVRFEVVREITRGYATIGRHDAAVALLESLAGQFEDEPYRGRLAALRSSLRGADEPPTPQASVPGPQEQAAVLAWEAEVRRRLQQAQERGDAATAQRYERMLAAD